MHYNNNNQSIGEIKMITIKAEGSKVVLGFDAVSAMKDSVVNKYGTKVVSLTGEGKSDYTSIKGTKYQVRLSLRENPKGLDVPADEKPTATKGGGNDLIALKQLLDEGIITKEEYKVKARKLAGF
jgi:hypothetical protein